MVSLTCKNKQPFYELFCKIHINKHKAKVALLGLVFETKKNCSHPTNYTAQPFDVTYSFICMGKEVPKLYNMWSRLFETIIY